MAYVVRQHTDALASADAVTEDGSEGEEEEDGVQLCITNLFMPLFARLSATLQRAGVVASCSAFRHSREMKLGMWRLCFGAKICKIIHALICTFSPALLAPAHRGADSRVKRTVMQILREGGGETSEEDGDAELEDGLEDGEEGLGDDVVDGLIKGHRQRRRRAAGQLQAQRQQRRRNRSCTECEVVLRASCRRSGGSGGRTVAAQSARLALWMGDGGGLIQLIV
eukprot:1137182-Pelagomonas_calceolata.AAC.2